MAATSVEPARAVADGASRDQSTRDAGRQHRAPGGSTVVTDVTTGLLIGIIALTLSTALAALIIGSDLAPYLDKAIGLAVLTSLALGVMGLLLGSLRGVMLHMQDAPAAVLTG